jgi:hypothetical protein
MRTLQRFFWFALLCLTATLRPLAADPTYTWTFYQTGFHDQPALIFSFIGPRLIPEDDDTFTLWDFRSPYAPTNCGNLLSTG